MHLAYRTYYTHREASRKSDYATLSVLRRLRRRLVNGYTNWRYSTDETPASTIGVFVLCALWPLKLRLDHEYRHLPRLPVAGGALLDVGCGDGSFLRIAQSCGWRVTGVDPDPKAVANCHSHGWNVLLGDIEQFKGETQLFDIITLSHVIEHVHDPMAVLRACYRLLKPGGRLWLETPNINGVGHDQYMRNWRGLEPPRHLVLFNWESLTRALTASRFVGIEGRSGSGPLLGMTKASEAIKQGLPMEHEIQLSTAQEWLIRKNELLQALAPEAREFLTAVAFKK